jgi:hypothetical protein
VLSHSFPSLSLSPSTLSYEMAQYWQDFPGQRAQVQEYYLRALEQDPSSIQCLIEYGQFLQNEASGKRIAERDEREEREEREGSIEERKKGERREENNRNTYTTQKKEKRRTSPSTLSSLSLFRAAQLSYRPRRRAVPSTCSRLLQQ